MWQVIAALFSALIGFGTGSGINNYAPPEGTSVPNYTTSVCYNPRPDIRFTLTWPDNFVNLADNRVTLNPEELSSDPPFFNTNSSCQEMLLKDTSGVQHQSRNYILVRENVRISSCKTDELAGPYNTDSDAKCNEGSLNAAHTILGTCSINGYTDLRKVAETIDQAGNKLEILWNPFTHNVGCNYNPENPNCGPGDRSNINLREFLYVIKSRDAFDPTNPKDCLVLWDAGSVNKDACSHYLDVYMAEDLYQKLQIPIPTTDPDWNNYDFYQQAILNCQEQNSFTPVVDIPGLNFPPTLLDKPFVAEDFFVPQVNKITPRDNDELNNYQYFVNSTPIINPFVTNLLQFNQSPVNLNLCPPGGLSAASVSGWSSAKANASSVTCYLPIGSVYFPKETNVFVTYEVFSSYDTPQTFYFRDKSGDDPKVYYYTITNDVINTDQSRSPALQLKTMPFNTENLWTWATPICKPAVYLYPEKPTEINVKLNIAGNLTASIPDYDPALGWNVKAYPDGTIQQLNNETMQQSTTYPYLYYEADVTGITIPKEGWVIEASGIRYQVSGIMKEIGFNEKEITDFLDYWQPRLEEKPYYFVTLLPEEIISEKENLSLSLNPDTIIRTRVIFEGLDGPLSVMPLKNIPRHDREGFVLTDWGGALVGKSCTDITVK